MASFLLRKFYKGDFPFIISAAHRKKCGGVPGGIFSIEIILHVTKIVLFVGVLLFLLVGCFGFIFVWFCFFVAVVFFFFPTEDV